jgi:signal transduction histidine kinase
MKTILIVDDEAQLRSMYALALSRQGYHVIEADSGATGLALARQHLPELILSDINMPGGDGTTLLHEIRLDPALRSRQVVLMTGRPDLVTPRKGMEEGADDFLVKPVDLKALMNCVEARFSRASISWRVEDDQLAEIRSLVPPQLPHEVFTPLAGIIGLVEILRSDYASLSPAEVVDVHNDIYQSALRLHRTFRNYLLILDFQNISSRSPTPLLAPIDVGKNIRKGLEEALHHYQRHADVTVDVQPCALSVKPEDLSLIVEELVDNACKFSRPGTPIEVRLAADGRLTFTDQGRGLTAEEIAHIGAFHQFDRKKNEQQGLGLGLVLVQKLAALYGAAFLIRSDLGKGTWVEIAFSAAGQG